jgi:hypothetical protein
VPVGGDGFCLVGTGNWTDNPGVVILRFNSLSSLVWQKGYVSTDYELNLTRGVELKDGSFIFTGPSAEFGHMIMMKTNAQGTPEWVQEVDGAYDFYFPMDYRLDTFLVGTTFPARPVGNGFDTDILIYRFGLDGRLLRADAYGTDSIDVPYEIKASGRLLIAGATGTGGGPDSTRAFVQSLFLEASPCRTTFQGSNPVSLPLPMESGAFTLTQTDLAEKSTFTAGSVFIALTASTTCAGTISTADVDECQPDANNLAAILGNAKYNVPDANLQVMDVQGRIIGTFAAPDSKLWPQLRTMLPTGLYFYAVSGDFCNKQQIFSGKFWVE